MTLDVAMFNLINGLPHPAFFNVLMLGLHHATRTGLVYYFILILLLFSRDATKRTLGRWGLLAGFLAYCINDLILKNIFGRVRPFQSILEGNYISLAPNSYSFPSGQAAVAFALATMWWLFFPGRRSSYVAFAFALLVAFNRIYLGHHYPSDVAGGALVGILTAYMVFKYVRRPS